MTDFQTQTIASLAEPQPRDHLPLFDRISQAMETLKMDASKLVAENEIEELVAALGMSVCDPQSPESQIQLTVFGDALLFHRYHHQRNLIDRLAARRPYPVGSDEAMVLDAMGRAFFSIFEIEARVPDVGLRITDRLRRDDHLLVDRAAARAAKPGAFFGSTLVPFEGFVVVPCGPVPLSATVAEVYAVMTDQTTRGGRHLDRMDRKMWSSLAMALYSGVTLSMLDEEGIEDDDFDDGLTGDLSAFGPVESAGCGPLEPLHPVGRNEPCPCGSGKKYKKCCGR